MIAHRGTRIGTTDFGNATSYRLSNPHSRRLRATGSGCAKECRAHPTAHISESCGVTRSRRCDDCHSLLKLYVGPYPAMAPICVGCHSGPVADLLGFGGMHVRWPLGRQMNQLPRPLWRGSFSGARATLTGRQSGSCRELDSIKPPLMIVTSAPAEPVGAISFWMLLVLRVRSGPASLGLC
jgi:hypothetical protein